MQVIDLHAHWFPQEWVSLLEEEGPANGAEMGRNSKGHVSIEIPGVALVSSFPTDMIDLGIMVKAMDHARVDVRALSLTNPMVYWAPPAFGLKLAQAYNDACAAAHREHRERFLGTIMLPLQAPDLAIQELGRAAKLPGMRAVYMAMHVGGKNLEGTVLPIGPILVAEQLPDSNASKKVALNYIKLYEAAYGADSRNSFGAHAWDSGLLLQRAIPEALKKANPGTPEFRAALREALENVKEMPANHGVFSYSATDHKGLDSRAVVLVHIENGTWKVLR